MRTSLHRCTCAPVLYIETQEHHACCFGWRWLPATTLPYVRLLRLSSTGIPVSCTSSQGTVVYVNPNPNRYPEMLARSLTTPRLYNIAIAASVTIKSANSKNQFKPDFVRRTTTRLFSASAAFAKSKFLEQLQVLNENSTAMAYIYIII